MATATSKRKISIKLSLNEEEAIYLIGLLQNPLTANEDPVDEHMRESIFNALAESGIRPR